MIPEHQNLKLIHLNLRLSTHCDATPWKSRSPNASPALAPLAYAKTPILLKCLVDQR